MVTEKIDIVTELGNFTREVLSSSPVATPPR